MEHSWEEGFKRPVAKHTALKDGQKKVFLKAHHGILQRTHETTPKQGFLLSQIRDRRQNYRAEFL